MKKYIFIFLAISVVAITSYFIFGRQTKTNYEFAVAQKQDVIQQVSVTGKVQPIESVDLAFEGSGKVSKINVEVGDKVVAGQALMSLDNQALLAQLSQAKADLKAAKANLDQLQAGTRPEEIQVQEAKVESAKVALDNAKKDLINKINTAFTNSDNAIRNKCDQFFSNPAGPSPQLNIQITNSSLQQNLEQGRVLMEEILVSWQSSLTTLSTLSDLDSYVPQINNNLSSIRSFLDNMALAVNSLTSGPTLSLTTLNTYKTDVSTGRANVDTATTNLLTAEETLKNDEAALTLAQKQLDLEKAGSTPEQIAAQEAQVEAAQANVDNYQAQLSKTIIYSPLAGIVTRQDAEVGEIVQANVHLVSVISTGNFEITANVPEADIVKVNVGDKAQVTLDAYGPDIVFGAKVVKIDPAGVIIEGVPTYKVTLNFEKEDERLKSEMTANIDILTAERKNVIAVPWRAVISQNGTEIVRVLEGKDIKEVQVKTGIKGSDGYYEILDGLKEGDKVITFILGQ